MDGSHHDAMKVQPNAHKKPVHVIPLLSFTGFFTGIIMLASSRSGTISARITHVDGG